MRRYIPITYDKIFKKVFGDPNNTDKLAYLLSTIFKIPFEDLKDNIEIIESEKRVNKVNEKMLYDENFKNRFNNLFSSYLNKEKSR